MSDYNQFKFDQIVDQAQTEFWEKVVSNYPEAKNGDLSPEMVNQLDRAMKEALAEWIDNNVPEPTNKTVEILQHNVEYWYNGTDMEMTEVDEDLVKNMIIGGYNQGDLYGLDDDDNAHRGWWNINNK